MTFNPFPLDPKASGEGCHCRLHDESHRSERGAPKRLATADVQIGGLPHPCPGRSDKMRSVAAGLAICFMALGCSALQAQWASIRANNRSEHEREHIDNRRVETQTAPGREADRDRRQHAEIEGGRGHEVPTPPRVHEPERVERRYHDVDLDRHRGYYWSGYHSGMVVRGLPLGYRTVIFSGVPYYYYEGVYYQPAAVGYTVVNPPPGVIVSALPPGAEALLVNGLTYYHAGGVFYLAQPNGFAVVPPPLGITVTGLPPGAVPVTINGILYYTANSVYYLPAIQNGVTVYTVERP